MTAARGVAAVVLGTVVGAALWAVGEAVIHGVCGLPVLHTLWCTTPGGTIGRELDIYDILALPFAVGVTIAGFWAVLVRRQSLRDWLDS